MDARFPGPHDYRPAHRQERDRKIRLPLPLREMGVALEYINPPVPERGPDFLRIAHHALHLQPHGLLDARHNIEREALRLPIRVPEGIREIVGQHANSDHPRRPGSRPI